jgi:hypothetical protein
MHGWMVMGAAASTGSGRDALGWVSDILTAAASFVVVVGGIAGARYLRRANLRLAGCELSQGLGGWVILRASAQIENKGFLRLRFNHFTGASRPSIRVAETVDMPIASGGRQISEVRTWVVFDLDSDLVDPGEAAAWTEVFHLDPPTKATVGYRVTCRIPVRPPVRTRLAWRLQAVWAWIGRGRPAARPEQWWEDQTFIPLRGASAAGVA